MICFIHVVQEHLEETDQADLDHFTTKMWPNIKSIYKKSAPPGDSAERSGEEERRGETDTSPPPPPEETKVSIHNLHVGKLWLNCSNLFC